MGYEIAINKAWEELVKLNAGKSFFVKFMADEYSIDLEARKVLSLACNIVAKDFLTIIILHYLVRKLKGLPELTGEWLPFRGLSGIEGYYPAFRKRSIEPILRKYGRSPEQILSVLDRLPGKKVIGADIAVVLEAFPQVPVLVKLWHADDEFGPDANILFDKSITSIFCTEDIVVLAGLVAASI